MKILLLLLFTILTGESFGQNDTDCPDPVAISPCTCSETLEYGLVLECSQATTNEHIEHAFTANFSNPKFSTFRMDHNEHITNLTAYAPSDLSFSDITLRNFPLEQVSAEFFLQFPDVLFIDTRGTKLTDETFPYGIVDTLESVLDLTFVNEAGITTIPKLSSNSLEDLSYTFTGVTTVEPGTL